MPGAPWACCCDRCADCDPAADTATLTFDAWESIVGRTGPGGDPDAGNFVSAGCLRAGGEHGYAFANWFLSAGDLNGTWALDRGPDKANGTTGQSECFYFVIVDDVFSATDTEDDAFGSSCASGTETFTFTRLVIEARRRAFYPVGPAVFYWEVFAYLGTGAGPSGDHADTVAVGLFYAENSLDSPGTCAADELADDVTSFLAGGNGVLSLGRAGTVTLTAP